MVLLALLLATPLAQTPPFERQRLVPAEAQIPHGVQRWGLQDGLPQAQVNALTSDDSGRLWIGTLGGLAVFDGQELRPVPEDPRSELDTVRILSLAFDEAGTLWIGTADHGVARMRPGEVEQWLELRDGAGQELKSVHGLTANPAAGVWVGHAEGLLQLDGLGRVCAREDEIGACYGASWDRDGRLWVAGQNLWRRQDGTMETVYPDEVHCVLADSHGSVWAGNPLEQVIEVRPDGTVLRHQGLIAQGGIRAIVEDPQGAIWFSGFNPILYRGGSFRYALDFQDARPPVRLQTRALHVDREGTVWMGGGGLAAVRARPLRAYQQESFLEDTPRIVLEDPLRPGTVWVGRYSGALQRLHSPQPAATDAELPQALALATDAAGRIYGISPKHGLYRLGEGTHHEILSPSLVGEAPTLTLLDDRAGGWWFSSGAELRHLAADGSLRRWGPAQGVDLGELHVLAFDPRGQLWAGGLHGLVIVLPETGHVRPVPIRDGVGEVRDISFGPDGTAWVAHYGGGITLVDPSIRTRTLGVRHGLHEDVVSRILREPNGDLILLGNRGVSVIDAEQARAFAAGQSARVSVRVFDSCPRLADFEGMGGAMPGGGRAADGSLLLPALQAVVRFDPAATWARLPAPRVQIDGFAMATDSGDDEVLRFDTRHRELAFGYRAITFVDPHLVRYQYRLIGLEDHWIDAGVRRVAHYSRLPPGRYQFEVRAANRDQVWSDIVRSVPLVFPARLTEQTWFLGSCVALLIAGTSLGFYRRLVVARRRGAALEAEVAARTADLAASHDRLERAVETRTRDLRQALTDLQADMEKRERLEAQLRRAERLESVGRLAGGIAHDFNNILTAILGEADLGDLDSQDPRSRRRFARIREAGERAARLTQQLLAFSSNEARQPEELIFDAEVRATVDVLRPLFPPTQQLRLELGAGSACVRMDRTQLEQVVMNLLLNARDAAGPRGEVGLRTRVLATDQGEHIELLVWDDGPGIPEEVAEHLFDPFFTTKSPGQGTGLGLASVHGIVAQSGGVVEVVARADPGARLRVCLPRVAASANLDEPSATGRRPAAPSASVLLCDDDAPVLQVMARALEGCGFDLLLAHTPQEALSLGEARDGGIDLLVTDSVMPGMSGPELATRLRAEQPGLRVAFVSGYSLDALQATADQLDAAPFLAKPFRADDFRNFVCNLISAHGSGPADQDSR